jgi:hypothetical protein
MLLFDRRWKGDTEGALGAGDLPYEVLPRGNVLSTRLRA